MNFRSRIRFHLFNFTLLAGFALLVRAAESTQVSAGRHTSLPAPGKMMFSEAGTDVIPLERRSRRKWDNAVVADLDQDGRQDLLLTEHGLHASVYWNNGGKFSDPIEVIKGDTHGVAVGDYDQDGRVDLIIYHGGGGGKKPRNPVAFQVNRDRSIVGGEEFSDFERSRGRAAKFLDHDGDGALDLVLSSFPLPTQPAGCNQYFHNDGNGAFDPAIRLPQAKWMGFRTLLTDFNQDGVSDVIFYGGANLVAVRGDRGGGFTDVSREVFGSLADTGFVSSIAEIDYDNDGDFDLFLTRADHPFSVKTSHDAANARFAYYVFAAFAEDVRYEYDLRIEGDFRMENLQMAFPDFDVFVGAKKRPLELKGDRHGGKDFVLTPEEADGWPADISANGLNIGYLGNGVWRVGGETKSATSGVVLNVKSAPSPTPQKSLPAQLWENRNGVFVDVTARMGINITEPTASAAVGDFDNDGWSDLFVVRDGDPAMPNEQLVLLNQGGKAFAQAKNAGVIAKELGASGGSAEVLDYNEDGRLDIIYATERGRWHLLTNTCLDASHNNYVVVKVGSSPSRQATAQGAVLTLKAGGKTYRRVVGATSAAFSQGMDTHLHVGLGRITKVDEAEVRWTNGETEKVSIAILNRSVVAGHLE